MPRETCPACRFDSAAYTDADVAGALRALTPWWRLLVAGDRRALAWTRPGTGVWSAGEYALHTREVVDLLGLGIDLVLEQDGVEFPSIEPPPVADTPATGDIDAAIDHLDAAVQRLLRRQLDPAVRGGEHRAVLGDGMQVDTGWLVRHACHDALHHLRDVARGFARLGAGAPNQRGTVVQVNVSAGGVPKRPVDVARIGYRGLDGDHQRDRTHHGRVFQAVSLFPAEAIARLQAAGHPVEAGAVGENLTLSGLDWESLQPGTRLLAGTAVLELSLPATPCAKNAQWFADRDFGRIAYERDANATRWYASVMVDGTVRPGDVVEVEPATAHS